MRKILPFFFLCLSSALLTAQDIHWTLYDMAPLQLNPALTGNFYGTARLSGIARTQSNSIANTGFLTYGFGVDAPIIKGLRDNDWVGVGLSFVTDKAGQLEVGIQSQAFNGSYHYALNKKATSYLTIGVQVESYGRRIGNREAAEFRDESTNPLGPPGGGGNQGNSFESATGYAGGLVYSSQLNKRTRLRIGGKFARIGNVRVGLVNKQNYKVPNRITIHGDLDMQTGPRTKFMPSVLFENYGTASAFVLQGKGKYLLDAEKNLDLTGGLGYRFGDALQVLLGVGWGDVDVGIGYDLPVSGQASEAIPLGGLELAVTYILKIYKEPQVDPIIFCPRF